MEYNARVNGSSLATVYRQVNSAKRTCTETTSGTREREQGQMYISLEEETRSTDNATFSVLLKRNLSPSPMMRVSM